MLKYFKFILDKEISSGVILIVISIIAMLLANISHSQEIYFSFLEIPIQIKIGAIEINKNMLFFINEALMTVFFLLIGLEVKRELFEGSLNSFQKAIFPIFAAIGGMIVPALIYMMFNHRNATFHHGWAIPIATDIAFALSILSLFGRRVPIALKIFLMALAIIDDLGAILIIAIVYSSKLSMFSLGLSIIVITVLLALNFFKVYRTDVYIILGIILWITILKSGIHSTLSGVIVGLIIPLSKNKSSPAKILENAIYPWVFFLILPLFAFANAGVSLKEISISEITPTFIIGIITALFIGKPLGVSLFCWLALKLKLAVLPTGITLKQVMSLGVLCGIGFTMSIFISTLAFEMHFYKLIILAKLGILISSLLSSIVGYIALKFQFSNEMLHQNQRRV